MRLELQVTLYTMRVELLIDAYKSGAIGKIQLKAILEVI
jgi:hypothetical protein